MENVFNPKIKLNEQYDLKGSRVNRTVASDNPEIAKKDLDFRQKIRLGSTRKALVLEQIEKDTLWLQTRNVIDYSLLVGIHFSTTEILDKQQCSYEDPNEISIFKKHNGGMLTIVDAVDFLEMSSLDPNFTLDNSFEDEFLNNNSTSPRSSQPNNNSSPTSIAISNHVEEKPTHTEVLETEEEKYKRWEYNSIAMQQRGHSIVVVYSLGIIDVLTYYDLKKMGEYKIKSLRYANQTFSVLPPKPYRVRYMKYISSIID